MDSFFLWTLTISLMFAGGQCISESTSCSTVNGETICKKQRSDGNTASADSSASFGPSGNFQSVGVMGGNTNTGKSQTSREERGNRPQGGFPNFGSFPGMFPFGGSAGPSDSGDTGASSSAGSSTSSQNTGAGSWGFAGSSAGGFAGGDAAPGFPFMAGFPAPVFGGGAAVAVGNFNPQEMFAGFPFFGRR